ncbi:MAG: DNA-3-methyladenine glycosylase [Nocardioidaceae bacterium]
MTCVDIAEEARGILGGLLVNDGVAVRITEVEAYGGVDDPASHAFRGPTARNSVMFGPPGHLYVYFSYGMHYCANIVVAPAGDASAVLLRAGEVVEGREVARSRRGSSAERDLARGPARLTQALGVGPEHNGADLSDRSGVHYSPPGRPGPPVVSGPRVGVSRAADVPWRFWIEGDRNVSAYRRSPRAPV